MPRPQAKKTDYVGTLSDGHDKWILAAIFVDSYHRRSIPCVSVISLTRPFNQEATLARQLPPLSGLPGQSTAIGDSTFGAGLREFSLPGR